MQKSDLRTGMIVENRQGERGMVLLDTEGGGVVTGDNMWFPLEYLTENLEGDPDSQPLVFDRFFGVQNDIDIVGVYQPQSHMEYYRLDGKPIWQRETRYITPFHAIRVLEEHFKGPVIVHDGDETILAFMENLEEG